MPDRDTVVRGLHDIAGFIAGRIGIEQARNFLRTIDDALDLMKGQQQQIWELQDQAEYLTDKLKEQEAVEPIPPKDESDLWRCGNCNHQLFRCTHQRYCEMCGRAVKWNGYFQNGNNHPANSGLVLCRW